MHSLIYFTQEKRNLKCDSICHIYRCLLAAVSSEESCQNCLLQLEIFFFVMFSNIVASISLG